MTTSTIRVTQVSDERAATNALLLAFCADPAVRWTWPEPQHYMTHFPRFIQAFGGQAFTQRTAHTVAGHAGVALWLAPGVGSDDPAIDQILRESLSPARQDEVFAVLDEMGRYHPTEPHWYLPLIGVDPHHQGQGLGAALLQHALSTCDEHGQLAYLESTNPASVPLYERHGFEVLGRIQRGSSPPIFPMLRQARGAQA